MDIFKIGHRGAKGHIAENTIASITKAIDIGVDGIEVDVHKCASGELVVFHDFTLDRVTNGTGEISKLTLTELKTLQVDGEFAIPTLDEVLGVINNSVLLNIELKGENTAEDVCRFIEDCVENKGWAYRDFLVSSFQEDLLERVYNKNKQVQIGVLTDISVHAAMVFAKKVHAVSIHPDYTMLTAHNVKEIQAMGCQVFTWTANNQDDIDRMKRYGVDGIISDFPERL